MRDVLQIAALTFLLLGFALFIGKFVPGNPLELPNNGKGAYAAVATSGAFANWGLLLMAIGVLFLFVRMFVRR